MNPTVISTTIPGSASVTPRIALGSPGLEQIGIPASWTPAPISFEISKDRGQTYENLFYRGNEVVLYIAAGQLDKVQAELWRGITDFKIRSGTAANPVDQVDDAEIVLLGTFSGVTPAPNLTPVASLTIIGPPGQVYAGADFPATQPGTQRVYTFDFVNEIAILQMATGTLGGSSTVGDMVGVTFRNIAVPGDEFTIFYSVQSGDTLAAIATALNRLINGMQALTRAGISATVNSQVLTISWPLASDVLLEAVLIQAPGCCAQPTETLFFADAGFGGETIGAAACDLISFEGAIDPAPDEHVFAGPTISGSKVSFLVGDLLPGITYRITMTATTNQQPAVVLYSHILCRLPT